MMADNINKRGRFLAKITPSNLKEDIATIQRLYLEAGIDIG